MKQGVLFAGVVALALTLALALAWVLPASSAPSSGAIQTASDPDLLVEYPVPGNPEFVAVEAPNRVWFTLPAQNLIGRLVVTSSVDYAVVTYTVPTVDSYPYDIAYANGAVWFTERDGAKIGRLDTVTGAILEYPVLTSDSEPTGIDVLPGAPTRVWFTERAADKLGQLVVTDTTTTAMYEYAIPEAFIGAPPAEPQDVGIKSVSEIWFTAPGVNRIARYLPEEFEPFDFQYVPDGGVPWSIVAAESGVAAWFTDRGNGRVVAYFPQTTSNFLWYNLPTGNGTPNDLVLTGDFVWCTEETGQRVVRVTMLGSSVQEFGVGGGDLGGIAADAEGHVWFAERDAGAIGEWRPPYFRRVFLPLVLRH